MAALWKFDGFETLTSLTFSKLCLRVGFFWAYFLAAPSPLPLLLFKLAFVSIGVSVDFVFFLDFLGVDGAGDAVFTGVVGVAGVVSTFDDGVFIGSGVAGGSGAAAAAAGGALVCF